MYSLATRDAGGAAFVVHRLVQDVTRRGLVQAGGAKARLTEALGWMNPAFTGDAQDVRNWKRFDPVAPHVDAAAVHADEAGIADPTGRLMNVLGTLFRVKALYARAEPLMRRALAIDEASLGQDDPTVAIRLNDLAILLYDTNRIGEATPTRTATRRSRTTPACSRRWAGPRRTSPQRSPRCTAGRGWIGSESVPQVRTVSGVLIAEAAETQRSQRRSN
jgi:Tetratricopeptide repeat